MERSVRAGETLRLEAIVIDDGQPNRSLLVLSGGGSSDDEDDEEDAQEEDEAAAPEEEEEEDAGPTPRQLLASALRSSTATVTVSKRSGLHFTWFIYRGPEEGVEFDPPQIKPWEDTRPFANSPWARVWEAPELPEDGRWVSEVTFTQPGTYVLRGRADDGGLFSDVEVTVVVRAAVS
jgi:hypothetical protein